jgi:hypothetical protein
MKSLLVLLLSPFLWMSLKDAREVKRLTLLQLLQQKFRFEEERIQLQM